MTFGEFLRRERLRQKLGLREFARLHGRSYTYLGNVETGKVSPGLD
ncbi:MAG: helix-turn-helix transcriptional regulator, partial [Candidatus Cloacimonetes bacterium]|nr:helix-turn-helix transcriptional regulator [Candidatus Cloacimonadota bacterium]